VVPDVQATLVTLDRKTRLASEIARQRGWRPARVGRLLVIRDDRTARRRIAAHETTFAGAFPIRPSPSAVRRPTPAAPSPDGCRSHRRTAHPASSLDCNSCQVHARGRSSSGRGAAIGHDGRTRHERRQNPRGPRPATSRLTAWRPHVGTSRTCARQRHAWQNPPTRRPNGSARGRSRLGPRPFAARPPPVVPVSSAPRPALRNERSPRSDSVGFLHSSAETAQTSLNSPSTVSSPSGDPSLELGPEPLPSLPDPDVGADAW